MTDFSRITWDQNDRAHEAWRLISQRRFLRRALALAQRDGIPDEGSPEFRLYSRLENDTYIATNRCMVSFRVGVKLQRPVALLEHLYADDENTHITGRGAIAIDLRTGHALDQRLFHQSRPGDYSSFLAAGEIGLDRIRKAINREKRAKNPNNDTIQALQARHARVPVLLSRFQEAAGILGISVSPSTLKSNRQLYKIAPVSQIVLLPAEGAMVAGL